MIARVKNIWAALKFAFSRECGAQIELDEEGEQELKRLLTELENLDCQVDSFQTLDWRGYVAKNQRTRRMLADLAIEIDEIVRYELRSEWQSWIRDQRGAIRSKIYFTPFIAMLPIILLMCGARGLALLAAIFLVGWASELISILDVSKTDAGEVDFLRSIFTARGAGNKEEEWKIQGERTDKILAKLKRNCGEEIERLIRQSHDEHRKQSLADTEDARNLR